MSRKYSVAIVVVTALCTIGCTGPKDSSWEVERWEFLPFGSLKSVTNGDTTEYTLERTTLEIVRSGRAQGDSAQFAVISGIRILGQDIAPGRGYTYEHTAEGDSIVFVAGRLTFRGYGNDVFASGDIDYRMDDEDETRWLPAENVGWRMARVPASQSSSAAQLLESLLKER